MFWNKRKDIEKTRKPPPLLLSQESAGVSCKDCQSGFCNECWRGLSRIDWWDFDTGRRTAITDFTSKAEFVEKQLLGLIPADFGKRKGEARIDEKIWFEELCLVGFKRDSEQLVAAMKIYRNEFEI